MSKLPTHARAVVIGCGIVGNSVAYHLGRLGWRDIVLLDKGPLPNPGGSTGHASNFIYLVDLTALLLDHPVAAGSDEAIDPEYIARLTGEDWGFYRTLQINSGKLESTLDDLDVDREQVRSRLAEIWKAVDAKEKPLRWRLRAQVGDRVRWYELPEEVRSPYQPE